MGQGVNTKLQIIAARTLGIPEDFVRVDSTNTSRIPNASPTSASTGADLNGMATRQACEDLLGRLKPFAAQHLRHPTADDVTIRGGVVFLGDQPTDLHWEALVKAAQWARVDLGAHAFYATPNLHYDLETERGRPFAYYSYGTSITEVQLDVLRGTYAMLAFDVVHDIGRSLTEAVDRGQIEGGVIQGMGWATLEQIHYAPDGRVLTGVNAYKIPDIKFVPPHFGVALLPDSDNPFAVYNSKAVGEPPFVHGLGAYFAVLDALRAVRTDRPLPDLPVTPERAFLYLHGPDLPT
jgi:xanthine dehydrogenase large subunit